MPALTLPESLQVVIPTVLISLFMGVGLLLLFREVACWYLKINKRQKTLEEIRDLLVQIRRDSMPWECPECGESNPSSSFTCSCGYALK